MRTLENTVLKKIFWPKRNEVKGGMEKSKLHSEKLHEF